MKLKQLLEIIEDWDTELVCDYDSKFSLCWGDMEFTAQGKKKFSKILNSECVINKGVIVLKNPKITKEDLEEFLGTIAGYVTISKYDLWLRKKGSLKLER